MKRLKVWLIAILVVMTALSVFTACNGNEEPQKQQFTVTFTTENANFGTAICETSSGTSVISGTKHLDGTTLKFIATENDGYDFDGWYSGSEKVSAEKVYQVTVKNNLSLTAKFKAKTFVFNFLSSDTNMGTVSAENSISSGDLVAYNQSVTVNATPKVGYEFVAWKNGSTTVSNSAEFTFTMPKEATTLTAYFKISEFVFNFSVNEDKMGVILADGYISGDTYEYNSSITLTAQEKEGYDFEGWYEGETLISGEVTCNFTIPANEYSVIAVFKPEKRFVTFYDGYEKLETFEVDYGTPVAQYVHEKEHHNFIAWFTDPTFATLYDFTSEVTVNFSLYGQYMPTEITYSVKFINEDGSPLESIETQTINEGETLQHMPPTPSKEGHDFAGWVAETADGTEIKFEQTTTIFSNLIVKPTFSPKPFSVKFYLSISEEYQVQTINYKEKAIKPTTPTKEKERFVTWVYFDDTTIEFNFDSLVVEEVKLLAVWEDIPEESCTVTFYNGKQLLDTQTVAKGGSATAPYVPTVEGKTFTGWEGDFSQVVSDINIYAIFVDNEYTVTFVDASGEISKQTVLHGQSAIAPDTSEIFVPTGMEFDGWDKAFDKITADTVVTAKYVFKTFTVDFVDGETEEIIYSVTVEYEKTLAVPETPDKPGYSFVNWYPSKEFDLPFEFKTEITGPITLYGKFEIIELTKYTVTFVTPAGDEISVQEVVEGNSAIEPSAPKIEGYTFVSWSADFSEITSNLVVTANYDAVIYTVKFFTEDGLTQIGETIQVAHGASASADAPSAPYIPGKTFIGWSKDISVITKNTEVLAVYALETRTVYFDYKDGSPLVAVVVEYGKCVSIPSTPSKPGSVFMNWYLDGESAETAFVFEKPITEDITLVANYHPLVDVAVVTFYDPNGNQVGNIQVVAFGQKIMQPAPYASGYVWCLEGSDEEFDFSTIINADIITEENRINLYAKEI